MGLLEQSLLTYVIQNCAADMKSESQLPQNLKFMLVKLCSKQNIMNDTWPLTVATRSNA